jgi:mRNA-degrading endonuclease toxin of MazEF toxin-antitoxin module
MKDSKFRRGQIWWMRGYEVHKETVPTRPVLIISADFINSNMANNNITVVPLTTNTERLYIKTNVGLSRHTRERNVIKCGELITINKNQLVSYESAVDDDVIKSVEKAVLITLGLIDGDLSDEEKVLRETEEQEPEIEDSKEEVEEAEEFTIKRNGKHIRWDAENEAHFMKTYQDFGAEYTSIMFGISKNYAIVKAAELRSKYPDFEEVKEG